MSNELKAWLYMAMAALAGAITSLSVQPWKTMSWGEVAFTIFVGASFAIYVTPWLAHLVLGSAPDVKTIAGLTYISASGSNVLLPLMIQWVRRLSGIEERKP